MNETILYYCSMGVRGAGREVEVHVDLFVQIKTSVLENISGSLRLNKPSAAITVSRERQ